MTSLLHACKARPTNHLTCGGAAAAICCPPIAVAILLHHLRSFSLFLYFSKAVNRKNFQKNKIRDQDINPGPADLRCEARMLAAS